MALATKRTEDVAHPAAALRFEMPKKASWHTEYDHPLSCGMALTQ